MVKLGKGGIGFKAIGGALPMLGEFESFFGELEPVEEGLAIFLRIGGFLCEEKRGVNTKGMKNKEDCFLFKSPTKAK